MIQLPDPDESDEYVKVRGAADTHTDEVAYFGTEFAARILPTIAQAYVALNNHTRKLSLNDMSLPKGGLFDWPATWAPPHFTHRYGDDVDINTKDATPCVQDRNLRYAVDGLLKPEDRREKTALYCEPPDGVKAHIDITELAE